MSEQTETSTPVPVAHPAPGGTGKAKAIFEQIWPGFYTIVRGGVEVGRIFAYDGEERWLTYTSSDPQKTFDVYNAIAPTLPRQSNTLTLVWRSSPEDQFTWTQCSRDITLFTQYRKLLPATHDYVRWVTTEPNAYVAPASGDTYSVFQGDGTTYAHVGYAVLAANEQHWLLFKDDDPNGSYKRFQFISPQSSTSAGSLQFEAGQIPAGRPLPSYTYVKCTST